jgi:hypothetical protein
MNLPYHHSDDGLVELRQRHARRRRDSLTVQVRSLDHERGPRVQLLLDVAHAQVSRQPRSVARAERETDAPIDTN